MLYFQEETSEKLLAAIDKNIVLEEFYDWVYQSPTLKDELGVENYNKLIEFDYWNLYSIGELSSLVVSIYEEHKIDFERESIILLLTQADADKISTIEVILKLGSLRWTNGKYYSVSNEIMKYYYLIEDYEEQFIGNQNELVKSLEETFSGELTNMQKSLNDYYKFMIAT